MIRIPITTEKPNSDKSSCIIKQIRKWKQKTKLKNSVCFYGRENHIKMAIRRGAAHLFTIVCSAFCSVFFLFFLLNFFLFCCVFGGIQVKIRSSSLLWVQWMTRNGDDNRWFDANASSNRFIAILRCYCSHTSLPSSIWCAFVSTSSSSSFRLFLFWVYVNQTQLFEWNDSQIDKNW